MSASNLSSKSASAGVLAAIVASLCCITPVFSFLAGIGGIAATFSWMEPFRPYLIAVTIGALGFAWYQKLRTTKEEMECTCETDEKPSFWQSKKLLGLVTLFALLMLAFPSYSPIFYPDSTNSSAIPAEQFSKIKLVEFQIEGMTCSGCEEHVTNAARELEGVDDVRTSYEKGNAIVKYDPEIVGKDQIVQAINKTGYKVIEKPN